MYPLYFYNMYFFSFFFCLNLYSMLNNYFWTGDFFIIDLFIYLLLSVSRVMTCTKDFQKPNNSVTVSFHFALILSLSYAILPIFSAVKHPISTIYDDIPFPTSQFVKSLEISILLEIIFFHGFLLPCPPPSNVHFWLW